MFFAVPAATIDREVLTAPSATIDNDRCWHYGGMHAGALFFAQNTNMRFITPCITYNEIQMLRATTTTTGIRRAGAPAPLSCPEKFA